MKRLVPFHILRHTAHLGAVGFIAATSFAAEVRSIETPRLRFTLSPGTGQYEITDKQAGVTWKSSPHQPRFGEVTIGAGGITRRLD